MKAAVKSLFYKVRPYKIPQQYNFHLGYIFHTENVFDQALFSKLLSFCQEYYSITGKRPICTVMAGTSPKVAAGCAEHKCSDEMLAARYHQLASVATLGYHGHFYLNPALYHRFESEIRSNNFITAPLETQFSRDLDWFKKHNLNHNGLYAGGWWFMNSQLIELLMNAGFKFDFSFSKSSFFRNQYSHKLIQENSINTGQSFKIVKGDTTLYEIQNLIGAHTTPFVDDFYRVLSGLLTPSQLEVVGVLNSHDYDLDYKNTLMIIRDAAAQKSVRFFDAEDLLNNSSFNFTKTITL
ncbi:hypothetical protein [Hymenobacter guriensis]|uniref:Uncharacterized protein n=1 Tax=Hymenobacter guriensis TaxID=2793065 RepID=A0ABS0L5U9_9BACT|nr:hypothetical protein [Hymenobacter guriensis]MBG8555500.1 hypothetical protein [Hymenobacter guriensis]